MNCRKCGLDTERTHKILIGETLVEVNSSNPNRVRYLCTECYDALTPEQQEHEHDSVSIRINEDGTFWLGLHKLEDVIAVCTQVTIYESRIKELEENALTYSSKIMKLEDEVEELTNKIIRMECK
jgi:hypothetical protein